MKKILLVLIILALSAPLTMATMYSCRDADGKLFISDNLQSLPAECRGDKQQITYRDDPDNLNYVPAGKAPAGAGAEFQQEVQQVENEQQQEKQQIENLHQRVDKITRQYQQLVREKRAETRSWSYNSREKIDEVDQQIAQIRAEKQQLSTAIEGMRMSQQDKKQLLSQLAAIED
jgi:hypothetical protein